MKGLEQVSLLNETAPLLLSLIGILNWVQQLNGGSYLHVVYRMFTGRSLQNT